MGEPLRPYDAAPRLPITSLHLLVLGGFSMGAVVWAWFVISGRRQGDWLSYVMLLGLFGVFSGAFIFSRIGEDQLRLFDVPVFLTILVFLEFGLAPLECFGDKNQLAAGLHGDHAPLLRALLDVVMGMGAFWIGCSLRFQKGRSGRPSARPARAESGVWESSRLFAVVVVTYLIVFGVNIYLLTNHLYSYLASGSLYWNNLASVQVLMVVSGFGVYALVVTCIEKYLNPLDQKWKMLFVAIFVSQCLWGLISGMKEAFIENFVIVAIVSSLVHRRLRKQWVVAAVFGLVVLYPLSNAYRYLVRGQHEQIASLSEAAAAEAGAFARVSRSSGPADEIAQGFQSAISRVDLLQSVALIAALGPREKLLLGDWHWWMLPIYPFVPRFMWASKPILNEGARFSVALGYGGPEATTETVGTSTAVTYPGDLYLRGGLVGVLIGMFALGVAAQWLTSKVAGAVDRRSLFVYASLFLTATDMEIDAFSFWSGLIRTFLILSFAAWAIYGTRRRVQRSIISRTRPAFADATARE